MSLVKMLKNFAIQAAYHTGLIKLAAKFVPKGVTIFMFHGVDAGAEKVAANTMGLHTSTSHFASLCQHFSRMGNVVSLSDAAEALRSGRPLDKDLIVLTFDDGYRNNYTEAFPILSEHRLPATIFTATQFVDENVPLWPDALTLAIQQSAACDVSVGWDDGEETYPLLDRKTKADAIKQIAAKLKALPQEELPWKLSEIETELGVVINQTNLLPPMQQPLRWRDCLEMQSTGLVTIGAHTHSHFILGRCLPETMRDEMATNIGLIEKNLGREVATFAYPNGKEGDFNETTRFLLTTTPIEVAVTTELGKNYPGEADLLSLKRFGVPTSPAHAALLTSGILQWFKRLRA